LLALYTKLRPEGCLTHVGREGAPLVHLSELATCSAYYAGVFMPWTEHSLDGGILRFHRDTLTNVLRRGPSTAHVRRVAPRTLQIGLLTPCNLRCAFCYRDKLAPSRLTAPFLIDLLKRASEWGVLEVAFGGGEPLLFVGFTRMLRELHATTPLGLGFTTNGTLLTDDVIADVRSVVSEIRVSAYPDNGYRDTLRRLRGVQAGINWLVTPANVGLIEPYVTDFIARGAKNVLLLGYKGNDPELHLRDEHFLVLRRALLRLEGAPLRLDVCWHPHLRDVPHLFERGDCGAGDEFLVITPDRAVQACSFANTRHPFETFEDLRRIYTELRAQRPEAGVPGCTRSLFVPGKAPASDRESAWVWRAAASNNSGDWTIAARFCDADTATRVAESLRELARAHEAFLASPEGEKWIEDLGYDGSHPTPPLSRFAEAHGFDWKAHGEGLWWEENGCGAPVLTAGAIGDAVIVYHPYCMGLPETPFRTFFARMGAREFGCWDYVAPRVIAHVRGRNDLLERRVDEYLTLVRAAEYPSDVKEPPPWGETCSDPRVREDEDRDVHLGRGVHAFEKTCDGVRFALAFQNTFAGALALHSWLEASGYADVEVTIEATMPPLDTPRGTAPLAPVTGLFGDVRPLRERLAGAEPETVIGWLFRAGKLSDHFTETLGLIAPAQVAALGLAEARAYWSRGLDVTQLSVHVIEYLPSSHEREEWARALWDHLVAGESTWRRLAVRALAATLPRDEAFARVAAWCDAPTEPETRAERLMAIAVLHDARCVELIEKWWRGCVQPPPVTDAWCGVVADNGLTWPTARRWIEAGRPLSLLAVDVLRTYAQKGAPKDFDAPTLAELRSVLEAHVARDSAPRVRKAIEYVLAYPAPIARDAEGL
jgi:MoaA/NifB/PqqE/SkfB family radical SAM enzyme